MSPLHFPLPVKAEGRFVKQSGPPGRFAHVVLVVEQATCPNIEFSWQVAESSIPSMFQGAVVRGVSRLFEPGARLAEFSPSGILVRVTGGTFHPTDSNDLSYEIASAYAFISAVNTRSAGGDA